MFTFVFASKDLKRHVYVKAPTWYLARKYAMVELGVASQDGVTSGRVTEAEFQKASETEEVLVVEQEGSAAGANDLCFRTSKMKTSTWKVSARISDQCFTVTAP